jgi:glucose-1-phosphate thymidylyltransferase
MRGILLAAGSGARLDPLTRVASKQLLPVFDKPMVYYPLSVLMLAGIREVLVITTSKDAHLFAALLGDGSELGMRLSYAEQAEPRGIAEALLIGRDFIGEEPVALILGDNLFFGAGLSSTLRAARDALGGAALFGYAVADPGRYGVAELGADGRLLRIEEKPAKPRSRIAVTGLYFYQARAVQIAAGLTPSARGELEISDVNNAFVAEGSARLTVLGRGIAWLDAGTAESLLEASQLVRVLEERQGTSIACLEEVAYRTGLIDRAQLRALAARSGDSRYGRTLREIAEEEGGEGPA